jgi:hypothetical protein
VDLESDAAWSREYLRYRLSDCSHSASMERILLQIEQYGTQPECDGGSIRALSNLSLSDSSRFRSEIDSFFGDVLRRKPLQTYVDLDESVTWMREYVRYRLEASDHDQATNRVIQQILVRHGRRDHY